MYTTLRTILKSLLIHGALLLLFTGWANAGGSVALLDPPGLAIKQRADQLVAMTKAGYHTALFSTTPKDKFLFASGTTATRVASSPKSKFSFAAGASVVVDYSPCTTICRQVVFAAADLTPIIYARPSTLYGTTNISLVVDVTELNSAPSTGLITVYVTKDSKAPLSFTATTTSVNNRPVQNSVWSFDNSNSNFYILTTSQNIEADGVLSFGLRGTVSPGATKGVLTLSAIIDDGSGGEIKNTNNSDADRVNYFAK